MFRLDKQELLRRQEARGRYPQGLHWYVAMVHCGQEERVRASIEADLMGRGINELFLPVIQPGARNEPHRSKEFLFRSYLFLRCAMNDEIYASICKRPSVSHVLGRGYRIPDILDDEEVCRLRQILSADCRPELIERCKVGDDVEIVEGLMRGIRGRVLSSNSKEARLAVSFSFLDMGSSVVVVVPRSCVRACRASRREFASERMSNAYTSCS